MVDAYKNPFLGMYSSQDEEEQGPGFLAKVKAASPRRAPEAPEQTEQYADMGGSAGGGILGAILGNLIPIPIPGVGAAIGGAIGKWAGGEGAKAIHEEATGERAKIRDYYEESGREAPDNRLSSQIGESILTNLLPSVAGAGVSEWLGADADAPSTNAASHIVKEQVPEADKFAPLVKTTLQGVPSANLRDNPIFQAIEGSGHHDKEGLARDFITHPSLKLTPDQIHAAQQFVSPEERGQMMAFIHARKLLENPGGLQMLIERGGVGEPVLREKTSLVAL